MHAHERRGTACIRGGHEGSVHGNARAAHLDPDLPASFECGKHRRERKLDVESGTRCRVVGEGADEIRAHRLAACNAHLHRKALLGAAREAEDPVHRVQDGIGIALLRMIVKEDPGMGGSGRSHRGNVTAGSPARDVQRRPTIGDHASVSREPNTGAGACNGHPDTIAVARGDDPVAPLEHIEGPVTTGRLTGEGGKSKDSRQCRCEEGREKMRGHSTRHHAGLASYKPYPAPGVRGSAYAPSRLLHELTQT